MTLRLLFPPSLGRVRATARARDFVADASQLVQAPLDAEVATNYEQIEGAIARASHDLVWAPPAICARVYDRVDRIYKTVRRGHDRYWGCIVVRKGAYERVTDLEGRDPAWVDRSSASGHLLAASRLRDVGIDPDRALGLERFYGSYALAVRAVLQGQADFCSIYCHEPTEAAARQSLQQLVGESSAQLKVLDFTDPSPSDGLVLVRGEQVELARRFVEELIAGLQAGSEPAARLSALFDADTFELATAHDFAPLLRALGGA